VCGITSSVSASPVAMMGGAKDLLAVQLSIGHHQLVNLWFRELLAE
jgi:hypothetical protein